MNNYPSFDQWYAQLREEVKHTPSFTVQTVPFRNRVANYSLLSWQATDGETLHARLIRPSTNRQVPLVLMFHDAFVPVRGWHHMTRFVAAGFAVLAIENRSNWSDITAGYEKGLDYLLSASFMRDAVSAAAVAVSFHWVSNILAWGEGLGGGMAIVTAAVCPERIVRCAAANPMPAAIDTVLDKGTASPFYNGITQYFRWKDPERRNINALRSALSLIDTVHFAKHLKGSVLLGTSGMDRFSPPETQDQLWKAISCDNHRKLYAKHDHERINDFEDELLCFMRPMVVVS